MYKIIDDQKNFFDIMVFLTLDIPSAKFSYFGPPTWLVP